MRYKRVPKAKPGQMITTWAHRKCDGPDLYFISGEGVPRCDRSLMNSMFCGKRVRHVYGEEARTSFGGTVFDDSFVDELKARGYDLTTLKFSIQKKVTP